jgi:hypothetical protein
MLTSSACIRTKQVLHSDAFENIVNDTCNLASCTKMAQVFLFGLSLAFVAKVTESHTRYARA